MQKSARGPKARVLKLFILDSEGAFVGDCLLDEDCVLEFSDFVSAIGDTALEDLQVLYIGECFASVIHGKTLSLIAVSSGRPGPDELSWSKTVLSVIEDFLTGEGEMVKRPEVAEEEGLPQAPRSEMPPPGTDLKGREKAIVKRERELAKAEEKAWKAIVRESTMRQEFEDMRQKLAELESQAKIEKRRLEREIERLKEELERKEKS